MKKFSESLKDFLYDATDYILMGVIIVVVIGIIGWRLDILFENDGTKGTPIGNKIEFSKDKNVASRNNTTKKTNDKVEEEKTIKIIIPKGSASEKTAKILKEKELIKDEKKFLEKVKEMGLEAKLKYGEYEIKNTSSMEDIIKQLSK